MSLLIDGYNLLHASGVLPAGRGPHTLERARDALLRFLAASLTAEERLRTTIVFDARDAPYNRPRTLEHEEMTIRFAPREIDADTLIEELIRADTSPKRLTVVSSDHRIQNAARRRRAIAVDSDIWRAELFRRRNAQRDAPMSAIKPQGPLTTAEVARWMEEFDVGQFDEVTAADDDLDAVPPAAAAKRPVAGRKGAPVRPAKKPHPQRPARDGKSDKPTGPWTSPFPPGYAEDIQESDEE